MTPRAFRDLPREDQIEMMAHRREKGLRESHASHVQRIVAKESAEARDVPGRKR